MESKQEQKNKPSKVEKTHEEKKRAVQEAPSDVLIRIFGQDMSGEKNIYVELTKIKGISWSVANALCLKLGLDKHAKVKNLPKETIGRIENELAHIELPFFLLNRRNDMLTGQSRHLLTNDLDIQKEFDIKHLKKIKSYRGLRHAQGLPVRGQRTRSHFKKKGGLVSVRKKDDTKA